MKPWAKSAFFIALNIATFYSLKWYYDTRQVLLVSALLPSVVKVAPIGPIFRYVPYLTAEGIEFKRQRAGFGVMGHGSGVYLSKDGLIVTCAHVVEGTPLVEIDPKERLAPKGYRNSSKVLGYVVGRDIKHDVALVRLIYPLKGIEAVKIASSVRKGLPVLTIGFPGPFHKYVTAGVISGMRGTDLYSDVSIAPGNSGGGVFDINGRLVGLARAMTGPLNIPISQGFSVLTSLKAIREIVSKYEGF